MICNTLWEITNHHNVINEVARRKGSVLPIPPEFELYQNCNNVKKKKQKVKPLSKSDLESHGQTLYSLLLKPTAGTPAWEKARESLKNLADCLLAYASHLTVQAEMVDTNRNQDHPVRTIGKNADLLHRTRNPFGVAAKFQKLDQDVRDSGLFKPVLLDEKKHIPKPFENPVQRYRFFTRTAFKCSS